MTVSRRRKVLETDLAATRLFSSSPETERERVEQSSGLLASFVGSVQGPKSVIEKREMQIRQTWPNELWPNLTWEKENFPEKIQIRISDCPEQSRLES